ncbi:MAG TPA: DoxX family protein [Candidatus Elarobacter sp.]|jgi:putative oxidoreductase|nr:DoxX family protein [Candidatus Elarobacter sp.]
MRANDIGLLILRLTMAIVMFPHGAQKALGWFGGPGIAGVVAGLSGHLGLPPAVVYLVIGVEFIGPILLVLGIITRIAALGIAIDMACAAILVHAPNGFFMNFTGKQAGEGVEFFVLLVGIGLALTVTGPGRIAIMKRI